MFGLTLSLTKSGWHHDFVEASKYNVYYSNADTLISSNSPSIQTCTKSPFVTTYFVKREQTGPKYHTEVKREFKP
jgi:hypothetical protein